MPKFPRTLHAEEEPYIRMKQKWKDPYTFVCHSFIESVSAGNDALRFVVVVIMIMVDWKWKWERGRQTG